MKTLLILLFPLLTFGQVRTWEHGLKMQSGFYPVTLTGQNYCLFEAFKGGKTVVLKVHTLKPIIGGIFLFTTQNHKYSLPIEGVNKRGFYIIKLPFYNLDLWKSLDAGINRIEFLIGTKFEVIEINDNINKLKEYARSN